MVLFDKATERIIPQDVDTDTLVIFAVILLGASLARGIFDFARTYTSDSLSQFVTYDLRNRFYDKLQRLSFAYHDREHTGDLMSKATADVEAIRRYVNMGMVPVAGSCGAAGRFGRYPVLHQLGANPDQLGLRALCLVRSTQVMASCAACGSKSKRRWVRLSPSSRKTWWAFMWSRPSPPRITRNGNMTGWPCNFAKSITNRSAAGCQQRLDDPVFHRRPGIDPLVRRLGSNPRRPDGWWSDPFILLLNQLDIPVRMSAFIINSFSRAISSGSRIFDVLTPLPRSRRVLMPGKSAGVTVALRSKT